MKRLKRFVSAPFRGLAAIVAQPRHSLPCLLTSGFIVLGFPPFYLYPLTFAALVPLAFVACRCSPGKALLWGWFSGWMIIAVGFYFILQLLRVFGGLPWFVALPIHFLFAAYQGLQYGLFAGLLSLLVRNRRMPVVVALPVAYVAVEFAAREVLIFPWYLGNATFPFLPFIQIADLFGGLGVTAVVALVNATAYAALEVVLRRRAGGKPTGIPRRSIAVTAALVAATLAYGVIRIGQVDQVASAQPTIRIGLVEADIGIYQKADPQRVMDNLLIHQRMSAELEAAGADLIVWPETAVNAPYVAISTLPTDDLEALAESAVFERAPIPREVSYFVPTTEPLVEHHQDDRLDWRFAQVQRGFSTPLMFGILTMREPTAEEAASMPPHPRHAPRISYNTAILIDAHGRVLGRYDKNVLLVFGEYVPLASFLYNAFGINFFEMIPTAGDVSPGEEVTVMELPFTTDDGEELTVRIGAMICYEDIIAEYGLALAEQHPNLFINIINDGWFEESSAAFHHMAFSVLRAVEHRIPLVRSTNTGVSSFIDPVGRVLSHTELTGAELLMEDVPIMPPPNTVYAAVGDVLGWVSLVALGGMLLWRRRRERG